MTSNNVKFMNLGPLDINMQYIRRHNNITAKMELGHFNKINVFSCKIHSLEFTLS